MLNCHQIIYTLTYLSTNTARLTWPKHVKYKYITYPKSLLLEKMSTA